MTAAIVKHSIHTVNVGRIAEILPDVIMAMIMPSLRKLPESEVKKFMLWLNLWRAME